MNRDQRYREAHREKRRLYMIEYRARKKRAATGPFIRAWRTLARLTERKH